MKKTIFLFLLNIYAINFLLAQNIQVNPYLQDASANSIYILWETDSMDQSIVEWGLTDMLDNTTEGISYPSDGTSKIHEVKIENLQPFTKYYYRVKTGAAVSGIFDFKTPPLAAGHEPFRIAAMSDMQRDNAHPDKFREIIEDGVMQYLENKFGGNIIDNLALVMIPGDLVDNGNNFPEWEHTFFEPAEKLFSHIPVYPVLGNHERNTSFYFSYFKMPENGTPGFEEHWWHKDYGNVRIIGLDSNGPFDNPEQLAWLDTVLMNTCSADSIDFVFAQLHHPHKSELWTPGESDFTGEVIDRLERFTTDCGKPSIHFFGHTHAYSRGQSRDHKHLWINVATAGGAIDNWGEFPNFDYDEFSVSQDDYGFVIVEITDDDDPKLVIKRFSRGDQDTIINNQLTDSLVMRLNSTEVNTPVAISPINEEISPECVTLKASAFSSPGLNAAHGQSHWQISTGQNDFSSPVAESWKNFENWYFEIDTQEGDDLSDEKMLGLEELTTYWWRVRYRDREFNWSDWSIPVSFSTGGSIARPNLLTNPGAENDLSGWTIIEGVVEALTDGICDGISPHKGEKYFAVGGLCEHSAVGICVQNVDVSIYADSIDAGNFSANYGGFLSDFGGSDLPEMRLVFLNQDSMEIGASPILSTLNNSWTMFSESLPIPAQTRTIQVELKGTRNAGTDNDSYFDDLFLSVGSNDIDCSGTTSVFNQPAPNRTLLNVVPNPVNTSGTILLPNTGFTNVKLFVVDVNGAKINCSIKYEADRIIIKKGDLSKGTYFFWAREKGTVIGMGKFVVL